jgi:hypothetical protein
VDRLSARFGPRALRRPVLQGEPHPRAARGLGSGAGRGPFLRPSSALPFDRAPRPLRLFDRPRRWRVSTLPEGPPAQFVWRASPTASRFAARAHRPEWWRDRPARGTRLLRVEDREGRRFWLFREGRWATAAAGPRWFCRGLRMSPAAHARTTTQHPSASLSEANDFPEPPRAFVELGPRHLLHASCAAPADAGGPRHHRPYALGYDAPGRGRPQHAPACVGSMWRQEGELGP